MLKDDDRTLLEVDKALLGPTMKVRQELLLAMDRLPVCAICPAGQWYITEQDQPHCFCTQFRGVMYGPRKPPVTACDAREDAMAATGPAQ